MAASPPQLTYVDFGDAFASDMAILGGRNMTSQLLLFGGYMPRLVDDHAAQVEIGAEIASGVTAAAAASQLQYTWRMDVCYFFTCVFTPTPRNRRAATA